MLFQKAPFLTLGCIIGCQTHFNKPGAARILHDIELPAETPVEVVATCYSTMHLHFTPPNSYSPVHRDYFQSKRSSQTSRSTSGRLSVLVFPMDIARIRTARFQTLNAGLCTTNIEIRHILIQALLVPRSSHASMMTYLSTSGGTTSSHAEFCYRVEARSIFYQPVVSRVNMY